MEYINYIYSLSSAKTSGLWWEKQLEKELERLLEKTLGPGKEKVSDKELERPLDTALVKLSDTCEVPRLLEFSKCYCT